MCAYTHMSAGAVAAAVAFEVAVAFGVAVAFEVAIAFACVCQAHCITAHGDRRMARCVCTLNPQP
jgi:hypothetical protein